MIAALVAAAIAVGAAIQAVPSPNPSIRGVVVDAKTNTPVTDVRVTLVESGQTTRTNAEGRFEFVHVPPRDYTLTISTIGYIFVRRRVEARLNTNVELTVPLAEGTGTYQESVTVAADATTRPKMLGVSSQTELGSAGLAELRSVGLDDPLRAIQALPGVATGDDFQAEFSVRGSAFRHVGIVMDGTPTQSMTHTVRSTNDAGSIAMINMDILSRGALFSGPHARPHGEWLGATLEFDAREGSRDRAGMRAAVSGTSASAIFEGPIGRSHRGSWLVSIRKSYIDWLVRKIDPEIDSTIGFSDAQLKLAYDLTPRQHVQLFGVAGDAAYRESLTSVANGLADARSRNLLASIFWRYTLPRAVISQRFSLVDGTYANRGAVGQHLADGSSSQRIWRADVIAPLRTGWTLEAGARREASDVSETLRNFMAIGPTSVRLRVERSASAGPATTSGWGQMAWRSDRAGLAAGLRAVSQGGQRVTLPWLLAERTWGGMTLRGGLGRAAQFVDPLVNALASAALDPERATAYDVSLEQRFRDGWRTQVTAFYRDEDHIVRRSGEDRVDAVTGARHFESTFPIFSNGLFGTSRGADLILARQSATGLSGWIGYSWTHTKYRDESTGETFDGDFDQRHTLNVFVQQRLSYRLAANAKLRVGSNFPIVGYFSGTPEALKLSTLRNQVRLPLYARLDVRVHRTFTFTRSRLTLFGEVMNLLGRDNRRQADGAIIASTRDAFGYVERLLPRVPSAGLLFEF
jgi:hypothetical protein